MLPLLRMRNNLTVTVLHEGDQEDIDRDEDGGDEGYEETCEEDDKHEENLVS